MVNLDGGTLNVGALDASATPALLNWTAGTLGFLNDLTVDTNFPPEWTNLTAFKTLAVAGTTTITAPRSITLDGGSFTTGSLVNIGFLVFDSGTLAITGSGGVTFGTSGSGVLFASNFALSANQTLAVTASTSINTGALLTLNAGILTATGGIANSGELRLLSSLSQCTGGTLTNSGLVDGNGRIDNALVNAAAGEVRVSNTDRLQFASPTGTSNAGRITLFNGGTMEFDNVLTNTATGVVQGRGALIATSMTNSGNFNLSGGFTDIYGAYTGSNSSKVTVTGGGTTTFYNPVQLNSGATIQVSQNSTVVFFDAVTGAGTITGSGTKDFEGGNSLMSTGLSSPGPMLVQSPASLTVPYVRGTTLTLYGNTTIPANGGSAGVSQLSEIDFEGGTLDLSNNDLLLQSTAANLSADYATLRHAIISARAGGAGLTASSADGTLTGLALACNSALPQPYSATQLFDGLPADADSLLVKFTYAGDANLDGVVDLDDYRLMDAGYLAGFDGVTKVATWTTGNFNYDGIVDYKDYALADAALLNQGSPLADEMITLHTAEFGSAFTNAFNAAVPEPASLTILAAGAAGLISTRRRTGKKPRP